MAQCAALPLFPAPSGERGEAGTSWPAEGEGQPFAPKRLSSTRVHPAKPAVALLIALPPLTLTLSPEDAGERG